MMTDREIPATVGREAGAPRREDTVLVTGGAGFIGCNVAHRLMCAGHRVLVYDNLSRPGVERNLQWLRDQHGERLTVQIDDVRDAGAVAKAVAKVTHVFHFAAQVAVTTSLDDPLTDFNVNARGTLNLLEAIRVREEPPSLIYTSTNKVYGGLDDIALVRSNRRYEPRDERLRTFGIGEQRVLDFHSPYGCSKGTADQYVLDYARSFGLRTAVFRMSCIYGPHQYGTEDQGWVAHFLLRAIAGQPIVLYGDGHQVRDILFIDDLVDAFLAAWTDIGSLAGQAFNIGGGPSNTTSLLELLELIRRLHGERPEVAHHAWRTGDQRYYVSNTSKFSHATGWAPRVGVFDGVRQLYRWLIESGVAQPRRRRTVRRQLVLQSAVPGAVGGGGGGGRTATDRLVAEGGTP